MKLTELEQSGLAYKTAKAISEEFYVMTPTTFYLVVFGLLWLGYSAGEFDLVGRIVRKVFK